MAPEGRTRKTGWKFHIIKFRKSGKEGKKAGRREGKKERRKRRKKGEDSKHNKTIYRSSVSIDYFYDPL